jgi:hypothetical protein
MRTSSPTGPVRAPLIPGEVGVDIYIEDSPRNVEVLRAQNFYTICFANSTNRGIGEPRAENWDDVYKLIKARAELAAS